MREGRKGITHLVSEIDFYIVILNCSEGPKYIDKFIKEHAHTKAY